MSFSGGTVAAGGMSGDIQLRFNKTDWSAFAEVGDYSYGAGTSYADAPKVTAYLSGTIAWGAAPA